MSSGDHHHDHAHGHDHHDHDHAHPGARKDHDDQLTHYKAMEIAVRELLIEKGILTADEVRQAVERMDARGPHLGAKVVAKAWADPAFKVRLLKDGSAAVERERLVNTRWTRNGGRTLRDRPVGADWSDRPS